MELPSVIVADYTKILANSKSRVVNDNSIKAAFLRDITIEPLIPFFQYQCITKKINSDIYLSEYDNIMQEVLNQNSELYKFKPDIIYIYITLNSIAPNIDRFENKLNAQDYQNEIENVIIYFERVIEALKKNTNAIIVINNFEINPFPIGGILETQHLNSRINIIKMLNDKILKIVSTIKNVYIFDVNLIISRIGYNNFYDDRNFHLSKNPFTNIALRNIAFESVKYISSLRGLSKKCIVLDCDNTLWGGVLGEEGIMGIACGSNSPGSFFLNFQRKLLQLKQNGVVLAINSKNNFEDVEEVFKKHPEILLSVDDFVSMKINWNDKSSNIIEISEEINISLEHIVFIDDSEFEIELVRKTLPQVETILFPSDYSQINNIFDERDLFNNLSFSDTDKNRTDFYIAEKSRLQAKEHIKNIDDYYNDLKLITRSSLAKKDEIPRIAQLTQKTNQFNLTTKRYNESDIDNFIQSKNFDIITIEAEDKYGPYGIVGLSILKYEDNKMLIDTFLLSCRAIGRGIERVLLNNCFSQALSKNIDAIFATYIPTKKNTQVKSFYSDYNFKCIKSSSECVEFKIVEYKNLNIAPKYILANKK